MDSGFRRNDKFGFVVLFKNDYKMKIRIVIIFSALVLSSIIPVRECPAQLLMRTEGQLSFAPYIHGVDKTYGLYPGYRVRFSMNVDIYRFDRLILTGLTENITLISRTDSSLVNLDKIHYVLSPGFRYELKKFYFNGSIYHESINNIGRYEEIGGAFWFNSIRIGAGSKGSSYLYLPEEYMNVHNQFMNTLDGQVKLGYFLHGKESIWTAKRHHYRCEILSNIRYHIGVYKNWAAYLGAEEQTWIKKNSTVEHKIRMKICLFRKGTVNFSGFFYSYVVYDSYSKDNEDGLGAIGYTIIF